jgi:hypothetical protein
MLSSHPQIAIAPETHYWASNWRIAKDQDISDDQTFEAFWQKFVDGKWFSHLGLEPQPLFQKMLGDKHRSFVSIFQTVMGAYAESVGRERWGEKTPGHYAHVDDLLKFFPDAKIIFSFRDPRAVCASLLRVPWGNRYVTFHAKRWRHAFQAWESHRDNPNVTVVRYEDVVLNPNETLSKVCDFLGESFHPEMVNRQDCSMPNLREGWGEQHIEQATSNEVSTAAIDKWKTQLSKSQLTKVEALVGSKMTQLNYQLATNPNALGRFQTLIEGLVSRVHLGAARRFKLFVANRKTL